LKFAFASGGEDYRQMIHRIFPLLSENVLDNRSIELRDYLAEPKETLMKAEFARIPSADVLESSLNEFQSADKNLRTKSLTKKSAMRKWKKPIIFTGSPTNCACPVICSNRSKPFAGRSFSTRKTRG
jgi:hypothetical protein